MKKRLFHLKELFFIRFCHKEKVELICSTCRQGKHYFSGKFVSTI